VPRSKDRAGDRAENTAPNVGKPLSSGSKLPPAMTEATEIHRTEGIQSEQLTVRAYRIPAAPPTYRPEDVKRVRELLGASQTVLAGFLGVNVNTLRSWEQGKRTPLPIACRFLFEIESDVASWRRRIMKELAPIDTDR
jgi:putative transcriptional regulator